MSNGCPHTEVINKLTKDMYYGNGKPGMTTRMEVMEGVVSDIRKSLRWGVRLLAGTFVTGIAAIIIDLVVKRK